MDDMNQEEPTVLYQPTQANPDNAPRTPIPRTVGFGLTRTYAANWHVRDALRELYQNWKDAIIQKHQINLLDFAPHVSATSDEIRISVEGRSVVPQSEGMQAASAPTLLGYIRFNKIRGSAEFTNFDSTLDHQCLEVGYTTKKDDERLAGGHGEGLKIAALVLSRQKHHVKIAASGLYWNFGFNGQSKANFYCRLTPAKARREPTGPHRSRGTTDPSPSVWEDVSVTVERGLKGERLSATEFTAWMCDTVDLHDPAGRIRTIAGDLLLEPMYQGRLFLKGIRVLEPSINDHIFRFGYNLIRGSVDRDRMRLMDATQVMEDIHSIWEHAIALAEANVLPRYIELFRCHPFSVEMNGAHQWVKRITAKKMWSALSHESKLKELFYYQQTSQEEDTVVIRTELKKEPHPLPNQLWQILRKYGLVRTPFEELQSRLKDSAETQVPDTVFAQGVARTLRALFALESSTRKMKVVFVHCEIHTIDLAYQADGHVLYILDKWLHFHDVDHASHPSIDLEPSAFVCHHVVEELYCRALAIICSPTHQIEPSLSIGRLIQKCQQQLEQMPRLLRLSMAEGDMALQVSFSTGHSLAFAELYGSQVNYMVILHESNCANGTNDMNSLVYDSENDVCDCPRETVPLGVRTVRFSDLNQGPWVPIVAKMRNMNDPPSGHHPLETIRAAHRVLIGSLPQAVSLLNGEITFDCAVVSTKDQDAAPTQSCNSGRTRVAAPDVVASGTAQAHMPTAVPDTQGLQFSKQQEEPYIEQVQELCPPCQDEPRAEAHGSGSDLHSPCPIGAGDEINTGLGAGSLPDTDRCRDLMAISPRQKIPCEDRPPAPSETEAQVVSETKSYLSQADSASKGPRSQANTTYRSYDQYSHFSRKTYARVTLREPNAHGHIARYLLYIHDILVPIGATTGSPRLVVTKYSFLADHLIFQTESDLLSDRELLLHFRDVAKMADEEDAELIDVANVVKEAEEEPLSVTHVTRTPDLVVGYFARYAVRGNLQDVDLFVTPLAPSLPSRGRSAPISTIPVASVFDLSLGNTNLSAGFLQEGYPVRAAVVGNGNTQRWWQEHCPSAFLCSGDPATVIAEIDDRKFELPGLEEQQPSRIVTIAGRSGSAVPDPGADDAAATTVWLAEHKNLLRCCALVALSSVWRADFIVLELHCVGQNAEFWRELAETTTKLLARGYAVSLRRMCPASSTPDRSEMTLDIFLLAAPGCTNPQWIDDALSDCPRSPAAAGCEAENSSCPPPGTILDSVDQPVMLQEACDGSVVQSKPLQLPKLATGPDHQPATPNDSRKLSLANEWIRGSLAVDTAYRHATAVSRIIGELSKNEPPSFQSFSFRGPCVGKALKRQRV